MSELTIGMKTILDESKITFISGKKFEKVEILWQVRIIVNPDAVKVEFAGINQIIVPEDTSIQLNPELTTLTLVEDVSIKRATLMNDKLIIHL